MHFPSFPQVACFDTQFHAELAEVARVLPIARELLSDGMQRYGFHGLSLESIVRQLGEALPQRFVVAHLGNGSSITAVKAGLSIDTSVGMTASGGVIMGTRSGNLDPGVLVYLMREKRFDAVRLEALVDQRSCLLGISGLNGDMRHLHEAAASIRDARRVIEMFCYSVRKQVAAMAAVLGGLDMFVSTGCIGKNDAEVRAGVCAGLAWCGIGLDESRNRCAGEFAGLISSGASPCQGRVLVSQEDDQIARHAWAMLAPEPCGKSPASRSNHD